MIEVHFINVGYGDAALILYKRSDGQQFSMLIDCGGETTGNDDPTGRRITAAEYLKTQDIKNIDIVLLSHFHLDHSGGILAIAENFTVSQLWTNYVPNECFWDASIRTAGDLSSGPMNLLKSLHIYTKALRTLRSKNTTIRTITQVLCANFLFGEIRILVGNPDYYVRQREILDNIFTNRAENDPLCELDDFINNTSLRAELRSPKAVFLFAGDIYAREWEKENISHVDVVKLPHHGHMDALTELIASKLNAKYAVISVSNTRTDCPSPHIVELLEAAGTRILITDEVKTSDDEKKHHAIVFRLGENDLLAPEYRQNVNGITK